MTDPLLTAVVEALHRLGPPDAVANPGGFISIPAWNGVFTVERKPGNLGGRGQRPLAVRAGRSPSTSAFASH